MSLVSLLATTTLITLATSTPMILAEDVAAAGPFGGAGLRAKIPVDHDHFLLIMLLNRRDFGVKSKPPLDETGGEYITSLDSDMSSSGGGGGFDTGGIAVSDLTRGKRIGSLSVVNSVDVLRERVLLELARRKAMENQQQLGENQYVFKSVGKRSGGFSYRDHRIARKKRLQYQLMNRQQQPERLLAQ
ncbi:diuretic hormone 44 [Nasonia vitripennis]|uniref:Corticotropin-releasing factor domain-containing protein n=1 Tax=Nasonia vitripennis TaxID=7425 RepID=A0A7M7LKK3_NASVI|nr:diuretic hormone 44 [Nasonia vitripennis]XP_016842337.1 diuretic hormone 44 [Nasonia vitripennis]